MTAGLDHRARVERVSRARERTRRRKAIPLMYLDLWDSPRTSQRRALLPLADPSVVLLGILGGNRSGKSWLMACWIVANALGRDFAIEDRGRLVYPVREWLKRNGLPEDLIPLGPGECWVASPNFAVSIGQIRAHIRKLCPEGTRFVGWDAPAEARIILPNGGQIISKAYKQFDQDHQTWEGANVRAIGLDEQPTTHENLLAAFARIIDQSGKIVIALTPLGGKSGWFYQKVASPKALAENDDYRMVHLYGEDNPHIPQAMLAKVLAKFPAWQRAARARGEFVNPEGCVYPVNPDEHVLDPFVPPKEWIRFTGTDWGGWTPHTAWVAMVRPWVDEKGETRKTYTTRCGKVLEPGDLVVYRELAHRRKRSEGRVPQETFLEECLAAEVGTPEGTRKAQCYRVADSEDPNAIDTAARLGWHAEPAKKGKGSVERGVGLVEPLLSLVDPLLTGPDGEPAPKRPGLYFTRDCPVTIDEMMELRWLDEGEQTDGARVDPRCSDHGPDCVRYVVEYVEREGWREVA